MTKEQFLLTLIKQWWDCTDYDGIREGISIGEGYTEQAKRHYGEDWSKNADKISKDIEALFQELHQACDSE